MVFLSADFRTVHARLAKKFNAPLVESEQHDFRNVEATVRGRDGAPQSSDLEAQ